MGFKKTFNIHPVCLTNKFQNVFKVNKKSESETELRIINSR